MKKAKGVGGERERQGNILLPVAETSVNILSYTHLDIFLVSFGTHAEFGSYNF